MSTLTKSQANRLFVVLLLSCVASSLMQTAMTTVLPAIMVGLHVNATAGQWLTSAFTLAMGIMIPVTPFLLRRFSTRQVVIGGLSLFTVGLVISGLATSLAVMLIGRVLQALASGIFVSITQVAILALFPRAKTGTYMGIYGLVVGGVPIIAPTLAGYVSDAFGYRAIFFGGAGLTLLTLGFALLAAKNISAADTARLDWVSFALSAIGFGGLTLGLDQLTVAPSFAIGLLVAAAISLGLFVRRQLRAEVPFLSLRPLANRPFVLALIASMLLYAVMMAGSLLLPIYLQSLRGMTATTSGLITLPGSLVMLLWSPVAGKLYDRIGMKPLLIIGSAALTLSCVGLTTVSATTAVWYIVLVYAVRMLAVATLMMPLVSWGLAALSAHLTADGSAIITTLRTIAGAISMVGATSLMSQLGHGATTYAGINAAFIALSVVAVVLVIIAVIAAATKPAPAH
ncbi:DHA2 family efflux MFS transporter permease subunit [Lacticaseibacillus kribbianus]|uniref:DHA2 family efflux MFS transporter permease subunit n=1 Tax=Lacticaseibacillus kribbianus TaxID=2926292 RepID=UPI001CD4502E|nr:DHA2 family efflux MFS transporter permease subunit [Lacticaseibacillus kribbianus]